MEDEGVTERVYESEVEYGKSSGRFSNRRSEGEKKTCKLKLLELRDKKVNLSENFMSDMIAGMNAKCILKHALRNIKMNVVLHCFKSG